MSPSSIPAAVSTPCVMVCTVDGTSGLCLGCYRTLNEIAQWSRLDEDTRRKIMAELPLREDQLPEAFRPAKTDTGGPA